jgi:transmembrane sensor
LGAGIERGVLPTAEQLRDSPYFSSIGSAGEMGEGVVAPPAAQEPATETRVLTTSWVSHPWRWSALAAAVLLTFSWSVWRGEWFHNGDYSTPVGGVASVPMQDGSTVTLNTDSEVRVAVTTRERRVELKQGEAFFEVTKDAARPFVVRAGNKRVIAVGTKFSVRREAENILVTVTEGEVRVETADGTAQAAPPTQLGAGSSARAGASGVSVRKRPLAEVEEDLSWRRGFVVFHEVRLAVAAAEFNRYNARQITIDDPEVGDIRIGGNFRATNLDAFIRLLEDDFPIRVQQQADRIVLTKN